MVKDSISTYLNKKATFLISAVVLGVAIVIANLAIHDPKFNSDLQQYQYLVRNNLSDKAEKLAREKLGDSTDALLWNINYVRAHYSVPKERRVNKKTIIRDDNLIQTYYQELCLSGDSAVSDMGYYCLGLGNSIDENYRNALLYLENVKNKNLKYLNNSLGYAWLNMGPQYKDTAESLFRREIALNGNLDGAYYNLFNLLVAEKRFKDLEQYTNDTTAIKYFENHQLRALYFHNQSLGKYAKEVWALFFDAANLYGIIAALLVLACWAAYLYNIDFFEKEKWPLLVAIVLSGIIFSFFVFPVSDYLNIFGSFQLNGGLINDFIYCFLGIGVIEETAKIIPLLLLLALFPSAVNEPFDYILYAGLSALGFAFAENILYFDQNSLDIIFGRALSSAVFHMFCSSLIAYGIVYNKLVLHRNPILNFIGFFLLAALCHGFYDFWLINKSANSFAIFTTVLLIISIVAWKVMIENTLNNSVFFNAGSIVKEATIRRFMSFGFLGILIFEYYAVAFTQGISRGNSSLWSSGYSGAYLLVFIMSGVANFSLAKGQWKAIPVLGRFTLGRNISG